MQYLMFITLIILLLIRKNDKFLEILGIGCLLILSFIINNTSDIVSYKNRFDNNISGLSPGYDYISKVGKYVFHDFELFRIIFCLIWILIIFKTIQKYTEYSNFAIALFILFPFLSNISQMRNALASAIVLYAMFYLLDDKKLSLLKYVLLICIAIIFHYASAFYLLFIFSRIKLRKIDFKFITAIVFIVLLFLLLVGNSPLLLIGDVIKIGRISQWLTANININVNSLRGCGILFIFQVISYILFKLAYHNLVEYCKYSADTKSKISLPIFFDKQKLDIAYKINILMFLFAPFYLLSPTYFRLFQNVLMFDYCIYASSIFYSYKCSRLC